MKETIIAIDNVSKVYRLGAIGGGTLQADIQSWLARKRGKEDPNSIIGAKSLKKNETFSALKSISLEIKKGERVGIIGHNGAGKSTLLKLLSRVTAPTSGEIVLNGRVTSMLEVGTGFHGELTGRENIYMNGAILGMSKKEIDSKIDEIINFSECGQFIDTPVKRYSSGMYVKLAFSVAAHLDSEIVIMDEVLAVGDMAFQKKCIDKMNSISREEGRTILYVSHNMNTIRKLCERCVVLDHGEIVFEGNVEDSIALYLGEEKNNGALPVFYSLENIERPSILHGKDLRINAFEFINKTVAKFRSSEIMEFSIVFHAVRSVPEQSLYFVIRDEQDNNIGISSTEHDFGAINAGEWEKAFFSLDISMLGPGRYYLIPDFYSSDRFNNFLSFDHPNKKIHFEITGEKENWPRWKPWYGNVYLNPIICSGVQRVMELPV